METNTFRRLAFVALFWLLRRVMWPAYCFAGRLALRLLRAFLLALYQPRPTVDKRLYSFCYPEHA